MECTYLRIWFFSERECRYVCFPLLHSTIIERWEFTPQTTSRSPKSSSPARMNPFGRVVGQVYPTIFLAGPLYSCGSCYSFFSLFCNRGTWSVVDSLWHWKYFYTILESLLYWLKLFLLYIIGYYFKIHTRSIIFWFMSMLRYRRCI